MRSEWSFPSLGRSSWLWTRLPDAVPHWDLVPDDPAELSSGYYQSKNNNNNKLELLLFVWFCVAFSRQKIPSLSKGNPNKSAEIVSRPSCWFACSAAAARTQESFSDLGYVTLKIKDVGIVYLSSGQN